MRVPAARSYGQINTGGAVSAELARSVKGAEHAQEDDHNAYRDTGYRDHGRPRSLRITPTMGSFCLESLSASMEQELHLDRYCCTPAEFLHTQIRNEDQRDIEAVG